MCGMHSLKEFIIDIGHFIDKLQSYVHVYMYITNLRIKNWWVSYSNFISVNSTVGSHLSERVGTEGVQISEMFR